MRLWRKKNPLTDIQRMKLNARSYTKMYVKRGVLKKLPCFFCKNKKVQAHHYDYSKPLKVIWMCAGCHIKFHKLEKMMEEACLK